MRHELSGDVIECELLGVDRESRCIAAKVPLLESAVDCIPWYLFSCGKRQVPMEKTWISSPGLVMSIASTRATMRGLLAHRPPSTKTL